jgi:hypothetical protein
MFSEEDVTSTGFAVTSMQKKRYNDLSGSENWLDIQKHSHINLLNEMWL